MSRLRSTRPTTRDDVEGPWSGAGRFWAWGPKHAFVAVALALAALSIGAYAHGVREGGGAAARAFQNADRLRALEEAVGLAPVTRRLHSSVVPAVLVDASAAVYALGYWPFLALASVLTYRVDRRAFRRLLAAIAASGLLGVVVMWLYPVAPPRLMGVDDVFEGTLLGVVAHPDAMLNPYAALPSFHVAWSLLAALALRGVVSSTPWRAVIWMQPLATSLAVVITANHWSIDVVAGLVLGPAAWAAALPLVRSVERYCGAWSTTEMPL